jgi:phosphopantothenoylcysteine decarboxylase/phosphopantothenate--cysteine ligase
MAGRKILLIVGGGIAAYKACELIRLCRKAGIAVRCVLTAGGAQFITAMTLAALSEQQVFTSLFDLKDEAEMGHIQLSREADLVVVCPATADLMAKMAAGIADDLATTLLLATDKKVLAAPAMNVRMWQHEATRRNVARLRADGVTVLEPGEGEMACGEYGPGRLPEPEEILAAIEEALGGAGPLTGRHVVVTAGPTHEPIDPVRVVANRSSGKQGFAIAGALAALGARVSLVAGPVHLETPAGTSRIDVETAGEMEQAVLAALPADAAVLVAAVADWRVESAPAKLKKEDGPPVLDWQRTPDILAGLARHAGRPRLLVGFAAETADAAALGAEKRLRKGADWIVANDVSGGVMGGDTNRVHLITSAGNESWPEMSKADVATRLAARIADALGGKDAG